MKELSQAQQERRLMRYQRLMAFGIFINLKISQGVLDEYLKVSKDDGEYPVVTALASEPLYFLNKRVAAVGGVANIFVDRGDGVSPLYAARPADANPGAEDLSSGWENGDAPISEFLDYLAMKPNGVLMPRELKKGPITLNMGDNINGLNPQDAPQLETNQLKVSC